ncbi:MAG: DUF58 domain-containing protein [Sulfolobales archaeon]
MYVATKKILLAAVALAVLVCVYVALSTGDLLLLSLLTALVFTARGEPRAVYTALFFFSVALSALNPTPLSFIACIAVVLLGVAYAYRAGGDRVLETVSIPPLVASPVYLLSTRTALLAAVVLLSLLTLLAREYLRLSKSRVDVTKTSLVAYLNTAVSVPVRIVCPGVFKYSITLDGRKVLEGVAREEVVSHVAIDVSRLGTTRRVLKVRVSDLRNLASVEHDPVVIEVRAQSRIPELLRRVEAIIRRYSTYISAPVVLEASPLGAGFGGGVGRGVGGLGTSSTGTSTPLPTQHSAFRVELKWKVPAKLAGMLSGALKSLTGDYLGVREYQPGDSPRSIHWKKSVRDEGLESIAVKVFGSEEMERASGGRSTVVIADLTAPNALELDGLLQAVYGSILMSFERSGGVFTQTYLYLKTPSGKLYFLKGKAVDVLYGLNVLVVSEKIEALYNYESWPRLRPPVTEQPHGALKDLEDYFSAYGDQLARDLEEKGVRKSALVQLVFSKATAFKYYYVSRSLKRAGYSVSTPGTSIEHWKR